MERLSIETWIDIFRNMEEIVESEDEDFHELREEFGTDVEVIYGDTDDEWILCHGYEVFEDGFKTEEQAQDRLNEVIKQIEQAVFYMI